MTIDNATSNAEAALLGCDTGTDCFPEQTSAAAVFPGVFEVLMIPKLLTVSSGGKFERNARNGESCRQKYMTSKPVDLS
jgi:hypothetical protein